MKLLLTSGPTREAIDDVRFISNVSSGRLGVAIAEAFVRSGHHVVFMRGPGSLRPREHDLVELIEFTSAASLLERATRILDGDAAADLLIHAAAVADYAPEPVAGKMKSTAAELVIHMRPTPKVVDGIRKANPDLPIIVFKLESGVSRDELHRRARATAERVSAMAVVANLLEDVSRVDHRADLLRLDGTMLSLNGREAVAEGLVREAERLVRTHRGEP